MIKINLTNEQFHIITLALTSSDIFNMSFEESGLNEQEQKQFISAFKKFGIDLSEDH
tara:strand:- start:516 stop:686 length:171 start_codon:yes stop_codon:yes gene_type:complete